MDRNFYFQFDKIACLEINDNDEDLLLGALSQHNIFFFGGSHF